jgi:cysteinyl-tRNA synthetase
MNADEQKVADDFPKYNEEFCEVMDDDLNTADGISTVFELVSAINSVNSADSTKAFAEAAEEQLMRYCDVLGLLQQDQQEKIDPEVKKLVEERQEARKAKNFARADEIRDQLKEMGITLKDTPQGVQIIKD